MLEFRSRLVRPSPPIGIPDGILRKPGPLTVDEYAIVKEHGALGDSIVRDVPWPGDGRPLRRVWTPQASVA